MAWNQTYWDIHDQLYWEPDYLGLRSIPKGLMSRTDTHVVVPATHVSPNGPLYRRVGTASGLRQRLHGYEEILNHVFDLTFAIAPDDIIRRCLLDPLGFVSKGPFESNRRQLAERYRWPRGNILQVDGFFVGEGVAVAVEMKLDAKSSDNQLMKYLALLTFEEMRYGPKPELGLLYIVPEGDLESHWHKCGLAGPTVEVEFAARKFGRRLPATIEALLRDHSQAVRSVIERVRLHAISWRQFRDSLVSVQTELDVSKPGDQTIFRLLDGMLAQLAVHRGTGLPRPTP